MAPSPQPRRPPLTTLTIRWQRDPRRVDPEFIRQVQFLVSERLRRLLYKRRAERDNPDDLLEITQEGALAAFSALRKWRYGRGTKPIREFIRPEVDRAIRKALDFTRRIPRAGVSTHDPEATAVAALSLQAAVWRLDPTTRKIIRWCLLDPAPATTRHAAMALGLSEATVKRRLSAGVAALTNLLGGP